MAKPGIKDFAQTADSILLLSGRVSGIALVQEHVLTELIGYGASIASWLKKGKRQIQCVLGCVRRVITRLVVGAA